jgi:virulence-associated protein VagC
MRTKLFRDGDGLAVIIPDELAFAGEDIELEIIRVGDVIRIFPVGQYSAEPSGRDQD